MRLLTSQCDVAVQKAALVDQPQDGGTADLLFLPVCKQKQTGKKSKRRKTTSKHPEPGLLLRVCVCVCMPLALPSGQGGGKPTAGVVFSLFYATAAVTNARLLRDALQQAGVKGNRCEVALERWRESQK